MKRDIYKKLLEWKTSQRRKPLLLRGARQVGKTYILQEFGGKEYESVAYFNFEEDPTIDDFFRQKLDPEQIISNLSLYLNLEIKPEKCLIIFVNLFLRFIPLKLRQALIRKVKASSRSTGNSSPPYCHERHF